jgi:hypothetical protein
LGIGSIVEITILLLLLAFVIYRGGHDIAVLLVGWLGWAECRDLGIGQPMGLENINSGERNGICSVWGLFYCPIGCWKEEKEVRIRRPPPSLMVSGNPTVGVCQEAGNGMEGNWRHLVNLRGQIGN